MRVLAACSLGGAGHLNPILPFLQAARRAGNETLVIAPPAMEEMVEGTGFPYRPGGEPPEADVAPIRERLPVAPREEASILGNRELFGRMATTAMLPSMEETCAEWSPDLILRDPCEYASAVVAHTQGIVTAQVAISLAEAEHGSLAVAAPAIELHAEGLATEIRQAPYLTRFPRSLDPSPFPRTIRFHEAWSPQPLPDWWGASDLPLVYATFGTVLGHMTIAADVYRTAIDAVAGLGANVLLTVGRKFDAARLGPLPDNVHMEAWVDQADVFAEARAVVCHGGSGTVFGALAAGLPLVVVPVFADQFENGRRAADAGAGVVAKASDPRSIRQAITAVLDDPTYQRHAERIALEMAATSTVDDALRAVLRGD